MPELRFGVLGALEVHVDGHPREIPAGRQRAALACLLAHAGRPVSSDVLVEAAWGDRLPEDPARALRTVLSRLRAQLGQDAIRLDPAGYRLTGAATDADEFTDLLERARTAEPAVAGDLLSRALALWRGSAYCEYADTPLISTVAEHLGRLRRDAVEARASALVETGEPAAAVAGLEELLVEQPFRESAVELLVRALYHAGRQTEALDRLRAYRALLGAELGLDPSPGLVELEGRILGHGLVAPRAAPAAPPAWLDTSTAFIGREDELADLVAAVAENQVTVVTGPGGVGKSRLAAESLPVLHDRLGLPIAVVELAGVTEGGARAALADGLGLRGEGDTDALVEFLAAVPHLLVLDNCEHLLDELAPLVATIARCRDVRVLATSRHRLGAAAELVLPLVPLRLPDPGATVGSQESVASVRMLGDRVRRLWPAFAVTADNATQVGELCRRCDGLPLALEIAASRVATTGVHAVLARLPEDLAVSGLAGVVDWSYRLLGESEQWLLQCLSVCSGDLDAPSLTGLMRHVAGASVEVGGGLDVAAALGELVESSLVVRHDAAGSDRYGLLEMVRAYAADRLTESGRAEEVRRAHAEWVREVAAGIQADWYRADGAELSARLAGCGTEVPAALRWAVGAGELVVASQISHALVRCWHWTPSPAVRDLVVEVAEQGADRPDPSVAPGLAAGAFIAGERGESRRAVEFAEAALDSSNDSGVRAAARLALAVTGMYAGDIPESLRHFRIIAEGPELVGDVHSSMALLACYADDLETAREHAAVALTACAAGSDHELAFARYAAGEVRARTDPGAGAALLRQAADEADRIDAEQVGRVARIALFALLVRGGEHGEAATLGLRLVSDLRRLAAWTQIWTLLRLIAELLADEGRSADAAFLLGAASGASGAPPPMGADVERYAELQGRLSASLGSRVRVQIEGLASGTPRTQVLSRAERLLADLREAESQSV